MGKKNQDLDQGSGSGMNILYHTVFPLGKKQYFGLKYLNYLMRIRNMYPGWKKIWIRNTENINEKVIVI
jgi:hypothetical protein